MNKWKITFLAATASLGMVGAANASLVDFDITLNFNGGLTASQETAFIDAEAFWEQHIIGYADTISFTPGLTISAVGEAIDGVGGVLGSAGPEVGFYNTPGDGLLYATSGAMRFDTADLSNMENNGTLLSVVIHEMAHVIGFGTLWELNNLYSAGTGGYTGQEGIDAYRIEFDANAAFVPVELDGGVGTADGHWDETWAGPQSDVMTGYIEGPVTFSETTYASFRDLGYATLSGQAQATSVSAPLIGAISLFGLMLFRRRSKV
jgi:hypothetical protein